MEATGGGGEAIGGGGEAAGGGAEAGGGVKRRVGGGVLRGGGTRNFNPQFGHAASDPLTGYDGVPLRTLSPGLV